MRKPIRWFKRGGWAAAALCALLVSGAPAAQAQTVQSLQERIQMLEQQLKNLDEVKKQLDALKGQLESIQKEQQAQKAKVEKQEKSLEPLGDLKDLKKAIEVASKLEFSGRTTGTIQMTEGIDENVGGDENFAVGALDLFFTYRPTSNVKAVVGITAIGGDGPDTRFPTFSGLNAHSGSTSHAGTTLDDVTALEAYIEATFFQNRLTLTAGKIDLTNYFDTNTYANNKKDDFISVSFTNTHVLSNPSNGPGVRARYVLLPDLLYVEAGAMNGDRNGNSRTTDKFFEDMYGIVEIGVTPKIFGRQGNYRLWGFADGAARETVDVSGNNRRYTAMGAGISFDQEITDWLGVFLRAGYRDSGNLNYATQAAWTAGVQLMKLVPGRPSDVIGIGYGEIRPTTRTVNPQKDERRWEAYYRWYLLDNLHFSPFIQFVDNRSGLQTDSDFWLFGARLHLSF